ncbi:unnamed protein product [Echinostoma caproni]|uniref:THUMP domain-containing protein n=1 Tax=Echinostoma caproni TaxID=27848 RepID=A0A183AZT9_9TREM|nr:unnamed protein product [Echinostoma caproni]
MRICSPDICKEEPRKIRKTFIEKGYRDKIIRQCMKVTTIVQPEMTVKKKLGYLYMAFKGDTLSEMISKRLQAAVRNTYYAVDLRLIYTFKPVLPLQINDKLPVEMTSFSVDQVVCSCEITYFGRITRRLVESIREHYPGWLSRGLMTPGGTTITVNLVETDHHVRLSEVIEPIYTITGLRSKQVKHRLLLAAKVIAIQLWHNPPRL